MVVTWFVLIGAVLGAGVFFFWLHSLPERMVHNKIQYDIVAVLALLSLFTHQHAFWVAALLIALITFPDFKFPDFSGLLGRIANSLESIAGKPVEQAPAARSNGSTESQAAQQPTADVLVPKPAESKAPTDADKIVAQVKSSATGKAPKTRGVR